MAGLCCDMLELDRKGAVLALGCPPGRAGGPAPPAPACPLGCPPGRPSWPLAAGGEQMERWLSVLCPELLSPAEGGPDWVAWPGSGE